MYSCLQGEKCRSGETFSFPKDSGYTNPVNHLNSCVADGQISILLQLITEKQMHLKKNSQFQELILVTKRERAMYSYVKLIVTQSLPLSIVEQKEFRSFAKFDVLLSYKSVRQKILNLV